MFDAGVGEEAQWQAGELLNLPQSLNPGHRITLVWPGQMPDVLLV